MRVSTRILVLLKGRSRRFFLLKMKLFLSLVTASWAISVYYAFQRTWKPFNPILGETYEFTNHNGVSFLSEQVNFKDLFSLLHVLI